MVSDGFQTCLPVFSSPPLKPYAMLCLVLTMQSGTAQTVCSSISPRQGRGRICGWGTYYTKNTCVLRWASWRSVAKEWASPELPLLQVVCTWAEQFPLLTGSKWEARLPLPQEAKNPLGMVVPALMAPVQAGPLRAPFTQLQSWTTSRTLLKTKCCVYAVSSSPPDEWIIEAVIKRKVWVF